MFSLMLNLSSAPLPPLSALLAGLIVLPVLILHWRHVARWRKVVALVLVVLLFSPAMVYAADLFIQCDWQTLLDQCGNYYCALAFWWFGQCG